MTSEQTLYTFRDQTRLAQWIKWVLYALVVMTVLSIISNSLELVFFSNLENGAFYSDEAAFNAAVANDKRQAIVVYSSLGIYLFSAILIGRWIYFANENAHCLSEREMRFTPGWAVGWYFVPFANFWKPYQAMKEIWLTSFSLSDKQQLPGTEPTSHAIIIWWWSLWLATGILATIAERKASGLYVSLDAYRSATGLNILSDIFMIPLCFVLLNIIHQINDVQAQANQQIKSRPLPDMNTSNIF